MKVHGFLRVLKIVSIFALAATVFGFAVMWLWNWLMPALFGLHVIGYWQALGLLVLSKILFSGFRGRPSFPSDWRARMNRRWDQMTPEEREKFRAGMRGRCGSADSPPPAPEA
jgi:hypothetical protein